MKLDVPKILEGLDRAADFIDEVAEKVEAARQEAEKPKADLCGFVPGDRVILLAGHPYPDGLRGTVDADAFPQAATGIVPVRREDNVTGDGFPARYTILAEAFDAHKPTQEEPWYFTDTPYGATWNDRLLSAVIEANKEDGPDTQVTFLYLKDGEHIPQTRTLIPLELRIAQGFRGNDYVAGRDPDANGEWRNFRMDRIQGYVRASR